MVERIRMKMPMLGIRKLYYLLEGELKAKNIKIGRDGLFDYLRSELLLIRPKKSYTKTTDSKHWLKKYPNLILGIVPHRAEQIFVSDITYN